MKRFIGKLILLVGAFAVVIIVMHVIAVLSLQDDVDKAYTLAKDVRYLFLGSSQVGCSIEERPELHNRVFWVSDTSAPAWYVRLLELERRGQLDNIDAVIVPYNYLIPNQQNSRVLRWAMYQELPITWRYLNKGEYSIFEFFEFVCRNLRYPVHIGVLNAYPSGRPSIATRPEAWRKKYVNEFIRSNSNLTLGSGCIRDWEKVARCAYIDMLNVCKRHNVRFLIYCQPVLDVCYDAVPDAVKEYESKELKYFEANGAEIIETPHSFSDKYFFDDVHFMEVGTRMFTDKLFSHLRMKNLAK